MQPTASPSNLHPPSLISQNRGNLSLTKKVAFVSASILVCCAIHRYRVQGSKKNHQKSPEQEKYEKGVMDWLACLEKTNGEGSNTELLKGKLFDCFTQDAVEISPQDASILKDVQSLPSFSSCKAKSVSIRDLPNLNKMPELPSQLEGLNIQNINIEEINLYRYQSLRGVQVSQCSDLAAVCVFLEGGISIKVSECSNLSAIHFFGADSIQVYSTKDRMPNFNKGATISYQSDRSLDLVKLNGEPSDSLKRQLNHKAGMT